MSQHIISFMAPVTGIESAFNTFRLGLKLSKRLQPGDIVLLADAKAQQVIGTACVVEVFTGELWELCVEHAAGNHRELAQDAAGAPQRLFDYLRRLYGPHIAALNKKATVIYLRRLEADN